MRVIQSLVEWLQPERAGPIHERGHEPLSVALERVRHTVRPGSLVFLLSDFAGLHTDDAAWLARLSRGNEVVMLHIYDALEKVAPPAGRYPVTDGARRTLLDTADGGVRRQWSQRFDNHVALLSDLARRHAAHLMQLCTDQPVGEALQLGLQPRRAVQRGGR